MRWWRSVSHDLPGDPAERYTRTEHDPLGPVEVPVGRLFGAQTARALQNFPISGRSIAEMPALLVALAEVNRSQSTNDAYATAVRLSVYSKNRRLVQALADLESAFRRKAEEFGSIPKLGRTQLQDAVPMTLGQEFGAFAATIGEDRLRANEIGDLFLEVNLGGTAIGTGIGANPAYSERVLDCLRNSTRLKIVQASNLFEATWDSCS